MCAIISKVPFTKSWFWLVLYSNKIERIYVARYGLLCERDDWQTIRIFCFSTNLKKKKVKQKCNRKYKASKVSELIIAECVTM